QMAYLSGDAATFGEAAASFHAKTDSISEQFGALSAPTTGLELWFNETNPFRKAWVVSLLTAFLMLTSLAVVRWPLASRSFYLVGVLTYVAALAWSAAGFYCRFTI